MKNMIVTKQVHLHLTAEQWDLYTAKSGCAEAANAINAAIETTFNLGLGKSEVCAAALTAMHKYSYLGAEDSEPMAKLEEILEVLFERGSS